MSTIKDIARLVGVSSATVSNALNGHDNVSDTMRERILKAAQDLAYVPNINARLMKSRSTNNIGVFFPYINSAFYLALEQELYTQCQNAEFSMLVHISHNIESQLLLGNILSCNIDAAIVLSDRFPDECIPMLKAKDVPVVFLDRECAADEVGSVVINNQMGIRQAVDYLARTGHRVIGHLYGINNYDGGLRREAFLRAMEDNNLPVDEDFLMDGHFSQYAAYSAVRGMMSRTGRKKPDAYVCADDETAAGCVRALQDEGLSVPRDVSVTGFSSPEANLLRQDSIRLSSVNYSMRAFAERAVSMLLDMLKNKRPGSIRMIDAQFVPSETTALRY